MQEDSNKPVVKIKSLWYKKVSSQFSIFKKTPLVIIAVDSEKLTGLMTTVWCTQSLTEWKWMTHIQNNPVWHVMRREKENAPSAPLPYHPACSIEKGKFICQSSRGLKAKLVISSVNPPQASLWNINHSFTSAVSWEREMDTGDCETALCTGRKSATRYS